MKNKKLKLLENNRLSNLVAVFSKNYVIEEMERNLRKAKSSELLINDIDDNSVLKDAILPKEKLQIVANSIAKSGLTNPLIVRKKKDHYEIIFGRKRLLACKAFKIIKAPTVIIDVNDEEMLFMLLADNREQRDGNIVEMALILKELSMKYHYNQKTLAELAHQSRSQITNILRILTLPKKIIEDISIGKLSYGHARTIIALPDDTIFNLVNAIYKNNLSVRQTEALVKEYRKKKEIIKDNTFSNDYNMEDKGNSLIFHFNNLEDKVAFINKIKKIKSSKL